jgi:hypothetical protein
VSKILDLLGLGQIKLSVTTVVCIVAALAFAGVVGYGVYEAKQIKTLETAAGKASQQITDLTNTNKDLSTQLKLAQQSAKINTDVSTADVQAKQQAQSSSTAIATNAQKQITTIVKKYQPQGPAQVLTPVQAKAERDEISTVRLNSAWQTYCQAVPKESKGCVLVMPETPLQAPVDNNHPPAQVGPSA